MFSESAVVEVTGENETWLVYMPANRSMTVWDWLRLPLAPVLAVIEMFRPQKDYVPTEEERQLACARTQIEESLKADPAFVAVGVY